jgi:hypothetical protein
MPLITAYRLHHAESLLKISNTKSCNCKI